MTGIRDKQLSNFAFILIANRILLSLCSKGKKFLTRQPAELNLHGSLKLFTLFIIRRYMLIERASNNRPVSNISGIVLIHLLITNLDFSSLILLLHIGRLPTRRNPKSILLQS